MSLLTGFLNEYQGAVVREYPGRQRKGLPARNPILPGKPIPKKASRAENGGNHIHFIEIGSRQKLSRPAAVDYK